MTQTSYSADTNTQASLHQRRWLALGVLYLASFMNLIDISIVNVALPQIQADTGATATQLKWVAEVYVLALAVGLLPFGRFGDVFGRKRMFDLGLAGFTLASIACGLAGTIEGLIAARAMQGVAAAMMVPQVLAIVHVIFPPEEKARVFGLFGTVSSLGVVAGPVLGGALISLDVAGLGWRIAFLINVPLGIAALVGAWRYLPALPTDEKVRPDWLGSLIFGAAVLLLIFPLIEGRAAGWPMWTIASLALVVPTIIAFVAHERRLDRRGASALIPKSLLSNRQYLSRMALITLFFSGIPGLFLVLAVFLQTGFGLSALESGLVTTPFPVGVMLATMTTERLGNTYLLTRIASGAGLLAIGMVALFFVIEATGTQLNPYTFALPLLICGVGMGTAIMSLFQITMSSVKAEDAGAGSGAMQTFQQIGAALGIAIAGQLFFGTLGDGAMEPGARSASQFVEATGHAVLYSIAIFAALTAIAGCQSFRETKDRKA